VYPQQHEHNDDVYQASRFLIEHQATRSMPSPLEQEEAEQRAKDDDTSQSIHQSPQTTMNKKLKKNAIIEPKRVLEDVLIILKEAHQQQRNAQILPTMINRPHDHQLDVNSVWVEMLLHNQLNATYV
jgi:hypothetical protein